MKPPGDPILDRERFLALYSSYARLYERFLENGFKTSTTLVVLIGWLLGSEGIRNYLKASPAMRWAAILIVAFGAASIFFAFRRIALLSFMLRARLDDLNYVGSDNYDQHEIPSRIYRTVVGQNLAACVLVIGILVSLAWR
ncbi:MAG TPA: hypothetical protein VIT62_03850 [Lysobacter sp.]